MKSSDYIVMLKNYVRKNGEFDGTGLNVTLNKPISFKYINVTYDILFILETDDNELCVFIQNPKDEDDCFGISIFQLKNNVLRKILNDLGIW